MIAPCAALAGLPGAVSYEYLGFNFALNEETSSTLGTLTPGTYTFKLHDSDSLTITPGNRGQNSILFGPAGPNYTHFNNFLTVDYGDADCVNGCPYGVANYLNPKPFRTVDVAVTANTLYYIGLDSLTNPDGDGSRIIASIDLALSSPEIVRDSVAARPSGEAP